MLICFQFDNAQISLIPPVLAGGPQGSVHASLLYIIYIYHIPANNRTLTATYADDTAILTKHPRLTSLIIQHSLKLYD